MFLRNNLTLPIDDKFWSRHRPGDQWNCKCWLEQTDEEATTPADMPDSADMPEPKAGLKGNPTKPKEIFSQDHPHFPNSCASCHLNSDGKVHGVKGDKKVNNAEAIKGNCDKCQMSNKCQDSLIKMKNTKGIHTVKNGKEEAKANLPQIMYEGMLSRIRIQKIKDFGDVTISVASYSEVFTLNKRFCQEKVDLAFYSLNNIMHWNFIGIPSAEDPHEGHKTTRGVQEKFFRGKAKFNDFDIEYVLRSNSQNNKYYLHNVVVNDL